MHPNGIDRSQTDAPSAVGQIWVGSQENVLQTVFLGTYVS